MWHPNLMYFQFQAWVGDIRPCAQHLPSGEGCIIKLVCFEMCSVSHSLQSHCHLQMTCGNPMSRIAQVAPCLSLKTCEHPTSHSPHLSSPKPHEISDVTFSSYVNLSLILACSNSTSVDILDGWLVSGSHDRQVITSHSKSWGLITGMCVRVVWIWKGAMGSADWLGGAKNGQGQGQGHTVGSGNGEGGIDQWGGGLGGNGDSIDQWGGSRFEGGGEFDSILNKLSLSKSNSSSSTLLGMDDDLAWECR